MYAGDLTRIRALRGAARNVASDLAMEALFCCTNPITDISNGSANVISYNASTHSLYNNTAKTFVIQHPDKPDNYLVHACLEGPEAGVYYKGDGKIVMGDISCTIYLPEYTKNFIIGGSVYITPIWDGTTTTPQTFNATHINMNTTPPSFRVLGSPGGFNWIVFTIRKDVDFKIEPQKGEMSVIGSGPYLYGQRRM